MRCAIFEGGNKSENTQMNESGHKNNLKLVISRNCYLFRLFSFGFKSNNL